MTEDESLLGVPGACPEHGDSSLIECNMCGVEFCAECHPGSRVCPDCSTQSDEPDDEDLEEVADTAVDDIDDVLDDDFDDDDADDLDEDLDEDW